jgi:P4 family phage/plasmid primase-like protien
MNQTKKPIVLNPKLESIPSTLKLKQQWICWKVGKQKDLGRYEKLPIGPKGQLINAHDSKNWISVEEAYNQYLSGNASGIAFDLFHADKADSPTTLVGGDIDNCVLNYEDGKEPFLNHSAMTILKHLGTYYEISPSGTGIRFFFTCSTPPRNKNSNGYEIYHSGRFLTITGHGWGEIKGLSKVEVNSLMGLMFPDSVNKPTLQKPIRPTEYLTSLDISKFNSALSAIPANIPRDDWRGVLFSIKAHDLPDGDDIAREWSKSAGPYDATNNPHGYDEAAFNNIWKYEPTGIGKGTLYFIARKFGWQGTQGELFSSDIVGADIEIYGDIFNGKVFKSLFEGQLLFCYPRNKWLKYDGTIWNWCEQGEELEAAKNTAKHIAVMAGQIFSKDPTNPNSKKIIQHAQNTHNINRLEAMLKVAAAETNMSIGNMSMLDSDPLLLGCKNGVLNLVTGRLLPPDPEMLITRQVSTSFDETAYAPNWIKFLDQCFLSDQETIDYIQKALGYSLTGLVKEEILHFCFGSGRNGKSVFANIITKLMGDYALTAPSEMLMRRDRNSATNDIARLCGSRLVLANETRSDQRFDDLTIKQLVSTERISARFLHNEFFEFWPTFKIWIRGNHKPVVTDDSEGAWRRIRLIPFENNLPEDAIDPNLEETLLKELDGILAWMVEGAIKWQIEGLRPSPRIKAASNQYRKDCDIVGDFISENCTLETSLKVTQSALWSRWQEWSKENGYFTGSKKTFTRRLKDRGISDLGYVNGQRAYTGIKLGLTTPSQDGGLKPEFLNNLSS